MKTNDFVPKRITRSYRQTINATPEVIFPLLCPEREKEWLDGWDYTMIYSDSGLAEEGAVFSTSSQAEENTIWITTKHDKVNHEVEFTRCTPASRVCIQKIAVLPKDEKSSYVDISYTITAIFAGGNKFIESYTEEIFMNLMIFWEKSMNYFIETGKMLHR